MRIRGPVAPMLAATVEEIPAGEALAFEPKWDGFRVQVRVEAEGGVELYSRTCTRLTGSFPETVAAVGRHVPAGTVLDGELVHWSPAGRLDFEVLRQRLGLGPRRAAEHARRHPVTVAVFDVLETADEGDLRGRPLAERRAVLERLLAGVPGTDLVILTPQTTDRGEAELWLEVLPAQGIEGLVIKPLAGAYTSGTRGWMKIKHRRETLVIVGGYTGPVTAPTSLVIGRYFDDGVLRIAGRTGAPPADLRDELRAELEARSPAPPGHPWPELLSPGWGPGRRAPIPYQRIEPTLVAQVSVDIAEDRGRRWRHTARLLELRTDLTPADVPTGLRIE
ncbi:ATP-dependent DNA ligase [Actinomadura sp. NBRC 104412]|nr:ATP-dependent DNA ligase [Actinomadura sp. NBRC 104412]